MNYSLKTLFIFSLIALLSFSLAAPSLLLIDDLRFDYSLESLKDEDGKKVYNFQPIPDLSDEEIEKLKEDDKPTEEAKNVKVYTFFSAQNPDGQLRVELNANNFYKVDLPTVLVTIPEDSTEIQDITAGIEVFQTNFRNTGMKLNILGSVDDLTKQYLATFAELNYEIVKTSSDKNSYLLSLKRSSYSVDFVTSKTNPEMVEIIIKGL